jgi:UDP-GlcNAc:undecaprenyl-phosphate/decaprenyl-phosphate GlcNAc-1-phosphate transferase
VTGSDAATWLRLCAYGAAGFAAAAALVPLVAAKARAHGLLAHPRDDRWHTRPVAKFGGVAMALALFAVLGPTGVASELHALAVPIALMFCLGLADDCHPIDARVKLVLQTAVAASLVSRLSPAPITGDAAVDTLVSIAWVVGITNAVNLLDNMDGLAGGVTAIAAAGLAMIAAFGPAGGTTAIGATAAVLAGVAAAFVCYNFQPASVFMGDGGSYLLGSALAGLTLALARGLDSAGAPGTAIAVLLMLLPIADTSFVTCLRLVGGRSAFAGGRDHLSHRIVALGLTERGAVTTLYALSLAAAAIAVLTALVGLRELWPLLLSLVLALVVLAVRASRARVPVPDAVPEPVDAAPVAVRPMSA